LKGKPAQAIDKILAGMREKYYQTYCLVDQGFVKNPDQTVAQYVAELNQKLGDTITIRRFVRYQIGEAISA
jgi:elongation factor Ts